MINEESARKLKSKTENNAKWIQATRQAKILMVKSRIDE
jgi:hypothetical protein